MTFDFQDICFFQPKKYLDLVVLFYLKPYTSGHGKLRVTTEYRMHKGPERKYEDVGIKYKKHDAVLELFLADKTENSI